jgi:MFS family permease
VVAERRAPEPMLPFALLRDRVNSIANAGSVLTGGIMFITTSYVPLFIQGVLGRTAIEAGAALATSSLAWPVAGSISGRLILRYGFRRIAIAGVASIAIGFVLIATWGEGTAMPLIILSMLFFGAGMGLSSNAFLLVVQNNVPWQRRGIATSLVQFCRTIGGAVGVAALGSLLLVRMQAALPDLPGGASALTLANQLLDPEASARIDAALREALRLALAGGLHTVFVVTLAIALISVLVTLFLPHTEIAERAPAPAAPAPSAPPAPAREDSAEAVRPRG